MVLVNQFPYNNINVACSQLIPLKQIFLPQTILLAVNTSSALTLSQQAPSKEHSCLLLTYTLTAVPQNIV